MSPRVRIPTWKSISGQARVVRRVMNFWPPFLAAGVRVEHISDDWREVRLRLKLTPYGRNYVGTQFGGSMFSMCDPFWMLGTLKNLGERDYIVWDKAGEIEFLAPGRTDVTTTIRITDELLDEIRTATAGGDKYLVWCENDIVATDGTVVARNRKQIYVRRKQKDRALTGSRPEIAAG